MQIKCDFCGNMVDETAEHCPNCGAALSGVNRFAGGEPKTIEELKQWYADRKLPPENVTRFFIGKNIKEPRAIGIYEENGDYIVYKNKASGERAVRYKGSDEAYAVNEIYQKLKSEIANQKSRNAAQRAGSSSRSSGGSGRRRKKGLSDQAIGTIFLMIFFGAMLLYAIFDKTPSRGYYRYNNTDYYYQDSSWYYYDPFYDSWHIDDTGIGDIFGENSSDYRVYDHEGERFEDSGWYHESSGSDSDSWDSDSSWNSYDSWDSGGMDWDSDW